MSIHMRKLTEVIAYYLAILFCRASARLAKLATKLFTFALPAATVCNRATATVCNRAGNRAGNKATVTRTSAVSAEHLILRQIATENGWDAATADMLVAAGIPPAGAAQAFADALARPQ
jgi:hypothetical protein